MSSKISLPERLPTIGLLEGMTIGIRAKPLVSRFHLAGIILFTSLFLLGVAWFAEPAQNPRALVPAPRQIIQNALRHPFEFAKSHVTGGVGVLMGVDPRSGLPMVAGVGVGSPAEKSGLKDGDLLVRVDGEPLAGVPIQEVADCIRGFTAAKAVLTVIRKGQTRPFDCTIRRASWNSMRDLPFSAYNSVFTYSFSGAASLPPVAVPQVGPALGVKPPVRSGPPPTTLINQGKPRPVVSVP